MRPTKQASLSDGRVRLYIQRCRRIPLPDGRVAVMHQIEPCPKSRCGNSVTFSFYRRITLPHYLNLRPPPHTRALSPTSGT